MADFTSGFWNWFIIIPTVLGILACFWLIRWLSTDIKPEDEGKEMDHVWDGDLVELNNPLPRWWLYMFYITLWFSIGYLVLYPGLGTFKGMLGWTQLGQYEREIDLADAKFGPLFKRFAEMDLVSVSADLDAQRMGERMFGMRVVRAGFRTCVTMTGYTVVIRKSSSRRSSMDVTA